MHRILQIPELVELICFQIPLAERFDYPEPSRGHDLAILARTSKIFQDSALNHLWSSQDTLAFILGCMPQDLWTSGIDEGDMPYLELARPIVPADWERPLFYLHRVKSLNAQFTNHFPSTEVFAALCLCLPTEHMFPNLRSLTWTYLDPSLFPCIHSLLCPSLKRLDLNLPAALSYFSLLPTIAAKCPDVTEMLIGCESIPAALNPPLRTTTSLLVRALHRLQTLCVQNLDSAALAHLASLPSLKSLALENMLDFPPSQLYDAPRFAGLTRLALWPGTLAAAIAFLQSVSPQRLETLILTATCPTTLPEILELYHTVTQNVPHGTLVTLRMNIYAPESETLKLSHPVIGGEQIIMAIRHLFCFTHLALVELHFPQGLQFDDQIILELAQAWPRLESLDLLPDWPPNGPRSVTLAALRIFAAHCPALKSLKIELDARVIPPEPLPATTSASVAVPHIDDAVVLGTGYNANLIALYLGHSPISDASAVAGFLSKVAPGVRSITSFARGLPEAREFHDCWENVEGILRGGSRSFSRKYLHPVSKKNQRRGSAIARPSWGRA
ncbi:hypothetical protein C8F04DRAFT_1130996 [Mycena alexandri]|uniref:F-box domain-containing protein n=1 Tax=Mycena alexandri TaxID=1745969 RepID=A0AAD6SFS5_9AGAR|nr:hypothetical protein C8F04DRAFT_1130996 [Mycena alexandri]